MEIYDLTGDIASQEQGTNDHFSGREVRANPTWTQITVIQVRNNSIKNADSLKQAVSNSWNVLPETKTSVITTAPGSVPMDDTSGNSKLSATTRLASSIALPLPKNLGYSSSNDWTEEESGFVERFIGQIGSGEIQSFSDGTGNVSDFAKNKLVNFASATAFKRYTQNIGLAGNPYKEVFYGGIRFRTFSFSWELAPKSEEQARTIERLIYQLELASHPEFLGETNSSAFWIPDSFEIEFKGTNLPKIERVVLTSMNTDYTPYGPKFIGNGYPAFVNLDLNFMEVEIRTKKEVREASEGRQLPELFS